MSGLREHTEQDVERVRMAMAEAGYPGVYVWLDANGRATVDDVVGAPWSVYWRAGVVAGLSVRRCEACFIADRDENDCLAPYLNLADCGLESAP